ncbi:MAG: hypothetical protein ACLGI2_13175 [Acidimicrobiia bacterium]
MLRRRLRERRWAAAFADDILRGCDELFALYERDPLSLPITIPIDEQGVVLLQPGGPLEAPRVPATLTVNRHGPDIRALRVERTDGRGMVIPGLGDAPLPALEVIVNRQGLDIGPGPLPVDEQVAGALATALLLTIGMKLTKARRPPAASG